MRVCASVLEGFSTHTSWWEQRDAGKYKSFNYASMWGGMYLSLFPSRDSDDTFDPWGTTEMFKWSPVTFSVFHLFCRKDVFMENLSNYLISIINE